MERGAKEKKRKDLLAERTYGMMSKCETNPNRGGVRGYISGDVTALLHDGSDVGGIPD
jgi:hypothetical protein